VHLINLEFWLAADCIPQMNGSAYDDVSIRQLLTMTPGVRWNEDYADRDSAWRC